MRKALIYLFLIVTCLTSLLGAAPRPTRAAAPAVTGEFAPADQPVLAPDTPLDPQAPAAFDSFGYSSSTEPLSLVLQATDPFWIDNEDWVLETRTVNFTLPVLDNAISSAVTIGPNQSTSGLVSLVGSVEETHPFKYYDGEFNTVYISMNGVVRFANTLDSDFRNYPMPTGDISPAAPLSFLAPFWADLDANYAGNSTYYNNLLPPTEVYVTYLTNANPYDGSYSAFAITWENICVRKSDEIPFTEHDQFSFQVVFKDNGDIFVNILELPTVLGSATIGIQDSEGSDGLLHYYNGNGSLSSMQSIKFTRPSPDYRLRAYPRLLGALAAGNRASYTFNIKNITEVTGTIENNDIYDVYVTSSLGWSVQFYDDENKLLKDSTLDGRPDTGPVGLNEVFSVTAKVKAPAGTPPGTKKDFEVNIASFKGSGLARKVILQAVVPAAYAQTYSDGTGTYLDLVWQVNQFDTRVAGFSGDMLAVENTTDGFTYAWSEYNIIQQKNYVHFSFIDRLGFSTSKSFFDHLGAASDRTPALAADFNTGNVGLVWLRETAATDEVWFALLNQDDPDGVVLGPLQVASQPNGDYDLSSPVAAFQKDTDGDFTVVWVEQYTDPNTSISQSQLKARVVEDISGSLSGTGSLLTVPASGELYGLSYEGPDQFSGNTILFYVDTSSGAAELYFQRVNGYNPVSDPVLVSNSVSLNQRTTSSDIITGNDILIAWLDPNISTGSYPLQGVSFRVLDVGALDFTETAQSMLSPNLTNADYVSVTADNSGTPVVVWSDADAYRYVYYAYLNPTGAPSWFISEPTLIQTLPSGSTISLSSSGQGLAAYDGRYAAFLPAVQK